MLQGIFELCHAVQFFSTHNFQNIYKINKDAEKVVSIAEAKSNFSEYVSRAAFTDEKIILTKRRKPIAAIISCNDLKKLKLLKKSESIKDIIGKWNSFEEIENHIDGSIKSREINKARDVSF